AMGLISYGFVVRGLSHRHEIKLSELVEVTLPDKTKVRRGHTSVDSHHRHSIDIGLDGKGRTSVEMGHWHDVQIVGEGAGAKVVVGPPQGNLIARAPIFGKLQILGKDGNASEGINVGNEWTYRGYIEGGTPGTQTKAAAIWTFEGVTREKFPEKKYPDGLPLELTLRVFRSYKGDIERGVLGEIVLRNPDNPAKRSGPILFESKEFVADRHEIPWKLNSQAGGAAGTGQIDLFDDLVSNGKLQVEVRCVEPAQYFGVATADCYLRPNDDTFEVNFFKGYLSIWLQMVLVTSFGVAFSTFLSGPVAMMATISAVVLGFFGDEIRNVASRKIEGGGPLESLIRLVTQQNVQVDLEMNSVLVAILKGIDFVLLWIMQAGTHVLPDYNQFNTSAFVADGYSIMGSVIAQQLTMAAVYTLAVAVVGYFFLKTREIAA
ncbi:MAG: hypothetical protein SFU86_05510, partial [Pirellulaceae bacterium]|nr:hypothetical protein [Pirellulaceae bacterium]